MDFEVMNLEFFIISFLVCGSIISGILLVIFGQLTVRKLRKNPDMKHVLGMELISGWDILNVAQALAIPKSWMKKLENSSLSFLYANSESIRNHTNRLDRVLGLLLYWSVMATGIGGLTFLLAINLGLIA